MTVPIFRLTYETVADATGDTQERITTLMKLIIEIQTLTPAQIESLKTALPTDQACSSAAPEWRVPGDFYSLPIGGIEL